MEQENMNLELSRDEARKEYYRNWRSKHRDYIREYKRQYYQRNKRHIQAYNRLWNQRNPEKKAQIMARYWERRSERMKNAGKDVEQNG